MRTSTLAGTSKFFCEHVRTTKIMMTPWLRIQLLLASLQFTPPAFWPKAERKEMAGN